MKNFTPFLCFFLLFLYAPSLFAQTESCTDKRYIDEIFEFERLGNLDIYGEAVAVSSEVFEVGNIYWGENSSILQQLEFDIYQPVGDTLTNRPMIVMAFGGAYLTGFKRFWPLVAYAEAMAKRGYVVASIDYRLGFNPLNVESSVRAIYRGSQDLKAAIRYFRFHAEDYGIDPDLVFAGGDSAGGISALHAAYVSEEERANSDILAASYEVPQFFNDWPDLGCIECAANEYGLPPYDISGQPAVVLNMWGALGTIEWMESANDPPVISFHGGDDNIVSVDKNSPFSADALFPAIDGANLIHAKADSLGIMNEKYVFDGIGHEAWIYEGPDTIIRQKSASFLFRFMQPEMPIVSGENAVCGGDTYTYQVENHAESYYCWEIEGGTIVSADDTKSSIEVLWNENGVGKIWVREINKNAVESELATLDVSIISVNMPQNIGVTNIETMAADVAWNASVGVSYEINYRIQGETAWQTMASIEAFISLSNLAVCAIYELQVREVCSSEVASEYSETIIFNTPCYRAKVKVCLEGAYDGEIMSSNLGNNLPFEQPYNRPPYSYFGTEILNNPNSNIVDWVLLEVQDLSGEIVGRAAGLLHNDGFVYDVEGNEGVRIPNLGIAADYHIIVRHRNHLDVMSQAMMLPNAMPYDFTTAETQAFGNGQQGEMTNGTFAMWAGDINGNGAVTVADFNQYLLDLGHLNEYDDSDLNLNGNVTISDFNLYLENSSLIGISAIRY
ncbi:MAG: carboxylesterase family protein [Chitinophagales bacterium]